MKKNLVSVAALSALLVVGTVLTSCDKDEDTPMPTRMTSAFSIENVVSPKDFVESGTFVGVGGPGVDAPVVLPGSSIKFSFSAGKGQSLMFATMYGASKDWFFAPVNPGLQLFGDNGKAMTGDVSSQIKLWDNGSKDNVTGDPEDGKIMMVPEVDASKLMKLELAFDEPSSEFTLTVTNMSGGTENETPFSPGVWAVSNVLDGKLLNEAPFFVEGEKTNDEITAIAQMGDNIPLSKKIAENTGIITGISPAVVVVYTGDVNPIFELNKKDAGMGLKNLAQMGDGSVLKAALEKMDNVKNVYIAGSAAMGPGESAEVQLETVEGDNIAYASMFGYSNDWFYANEAALPATFKGDATSKTSLFDDGTAVSQYPGAGNKQGLFAGGSEAEDMAIMKVGDKYPVPAVNDVVKITIR
ncbi:MAG: spondin domain-containing protein [Parabacteroides sp.]|nr:spondin domain-containing protein [Parabacteroides sp.]